MEELKQKKRHEKEKKKKKDREDKEKGLEMRDAAVSGLASKFL